MKRNSLLVIATFAVLPFLPARSKDGANCAGAYATSPEHPETWVVGANLSNQALRWNAKHGELVAVVKYSTRDWADNVNPTREDDFILPFPSVRFNPARNQFTAHGVAIGELRECFLGPTVLLFPGVALSIHRRHGIVYAAIVHQDAFD